jgi:biofilm PGA synthesis N-glycosyltransferase PgaC
VARDAGALVQSNKTSRGKPQSIWTFVNARILVNTHDAVIIMDDDTELAPNFVQECIKAMKDDVAIVVGKTVTNWPKERRWNAWVGSRAYAYWRYQALLRQGQSALNVMNCISGSNSMYRSDVLKEVVIKDTPYIVDDTYWTLETHRKKLGKIKYAPRAEALIQDPTNFKDWYKQNLRWLWGSFQGVWGHRVGRKKSLFDLTYAALIFDWAWYVLATPILFAVALSQSYVDPAWAAVLYFGGYGVWTLLASMALKKWRLFLMTPAIIIIDWVYRVIFIHAFIKSIRQPTVESCAWESPARYQTT